MELLSTENGLEGLAAVATATIGGHAALADARALFATDLARIERELARAARDGEAAATFAGSHLVSSGGKRIRALAVLLSCACFGDIDDAARELAIVAEMVHTATLLHDDVIDDGDERRGKPAARKLYGNAVSVLAGDLLLTHALDRTSRAAPAAMADLLVTLRRLVDGEVIQLRGRTEVDVSIATYERIVAGKTASLFGFATRAGARAGGAPESSLAAMGEFGEHVGTAFQLVDDALDYMGDPAITGKALLADLHEGKVTLPLALTIAADPSLLADVARVRSGDKAAAERLARAVRASGACDETRRRAQSATERAKAAARSLPSSRARDLLARVATELTSRAS